MTERFFTWDEITEGLILLSVTKTEDEQAKRRKKQTVAVETPAVYCPHAYLILNFKETLNDKEKIKFRRCYLRKVPPTEVDVIILQDIKDVVLALLISPVSVQFINFLHLPIVDRFLRALIIYFQHYVDIYEDLVQERAATMKKAPNPLARGHRTRYAEQMRALRCVLGREYMDLILGCQDGPQYHHMMTRKKRAITQSQGEKDLRIFEALISVAHRVVWIALHRKHHTLIEVELHRLFRTDAYNTAYRQSGGEVVRDMLENDIRVLQGPKVTLKRKLLRNSPLSHETIHTDCGYHLLSLGVVDIAVEDPKIVYLRNALLADEEALPGLGVKVGILGHDRSDYDIMLMPIEEQVDLTEADLLDKRAAKIQEPDQILEYETLEEFPVKEVEMLNEKYDKIRKAARRKWILRELKRHKRKPNDTYSLQTI
ncbi:PREDICTED: uncharacterized protein LOC106747011 [Dinoponera quadriceps]|uniref:Uncharacterized protein LOC106747011 n=1 Tax=Dinoponera quadriceps TaxID=609295 RepID=A0A6P3XNA4_DINQU|nr:PREDICTED: uncharacterized protein LOC106747011 [Dinoponera quadriceps]XP_014479727.1 PREDICTED: uncharacterized protein LOC106747011 [Dinoponera quadriceps]XP_014479728.1 PREDICTED: uncharacterized protein LOC106747011 [Dinoponera quadriceps]